MLLLLLRGWRGLRPPFPVGDGELRGGRASEADPESGPRCRGAASGTAGPVEGGVVQVPNFLMCERSEALA